VIEEYIKKSDVMNKIDMLYCNSHNFQEGVRQTKVVINNLPVYTFPEPEQKPEIQLMPIRDLSAKTGNAAKEIIGRPLGYCLKTGKLWPKPDKPYDIFVRASSKPEQKATKLQEMIDNIWEQVAEDDSRVVTYEINDNTLIKALQEISRRLDALDGGK